MEWCHLFLLDLFQLLSVAIQPHHFVQLTRGAKADIYWWLCFLTKGNGRSFFPQCIHVYMDSSGSIGCSGFQLTVCWFKLAWPRNLHRSIAAFELIPVVVAAILWGDSWHGKLVCFHSDNEVVVNILNKSRAHNITLNHLMLCLALLALLASFHGFQFCSVHMPGRLNEVADALSRSNLTLFHSVLLQALQESIITLSVVRLLVIETPD